MTPWPWQTSPQKLRMVFVKVQGGCESRSWPSLLTPRDVAAGTAAFATFMEMDLAGLGSSMMTEL